MRYDIHIWYTKEINDEIEIFAPLSELEDGPSMSDTIKWPKWKPKWPKWI
jgi:hypothetical protein